MRRGLLNTLGLIVLGVIALGTGPARAETIANGPYYATPSWDQTLPSSTRFIVLSNMSSAAVLDRETGLVWEKSPDTTGREWQVAQFHCNQRTVGNRKGWRLPTIQELASLVDPTQSNPALPPGHPFQYVQSSFYWSATTSPLPSSGAGFAWYVYFGDGTVDLLDRTTLPFVWCVRGGQGVDPQ